MCENINNVVSLLMLPRHAHPNMITHLSIHSAACNRPNRHAARHIYDCWKAYNFARILKAAPATIARIFSSSNLLRKQTHTQTYSHMQTIFRRALCAIYRHIWLILISVNIVGCWQWDMLTGGVLCVYHDDEMRDEYVRSEYIFKNNQTNIVWIQWIRG